MELMQVKDKKEKKTISLCFCKCFSQQKQALGMDAFFHSACFQLPPRQKKKKTTNPQLDCIFRMARQGWPICLGQRLDSLRNAWHSDDTRRWTAIWWEMTEAHKTRTERVRGTKGLDDEGLHSWMVEGDKGGWWAMKVKRQTGRRQCRRACWKGKFTVGQTTNNFTPWPQKCVCTELNNKEKSMESGLQQSFTVHAKCKHWLYSVINIRCMASLNKTDKMAL